MNFEQCNFVHGIKTKRLTTVDESVNTNVLRQVYNKKNIIYFMSKSYK